MKTGLALAFTLVAVARGEESSPELDGLSFRARVSQLLQDQPQPKWFETPTGDATNGPSPFGRIEPKFDYDSLLKSLQLPAGESTQTGLTGPYPDLLKSPLDFDGFAGSSWTGDNWKLPLPKYAFPRYEFQPQDLSISPLLAPPQPNYRRYVPLAWLGVLVLINALPACWAGLCRLGKALVR